MNIVMSCNYFWPYYVCFQYQNVRNISQKLGLIAHLSGNIFLELTYQWKGLLQNQ